MAAKQRKAKANAYYGKTQMARAHTLDDMELFNKFREEIAPKLRAMLNDKKTKAEDIYAFMTKYAAARTGTIIMAEPDTGKALAAVKEILDRSMGRPVERKETKHTFEKLKDEELDSLILSRMKEMEEDDSDTAVN
jgi:signal transduction histidine kinase